MSQSNKYFASYSQFGTATTYNSVGRTLEVFFDEAQRDAWVKADTSKSPKRQAVNLRQACTIMFKAGEYQVHERDGSTYMKRQSDQPDIRLQDSLIDLTAKDLS